MPKNKFQDVVFTAIMATIMVYGMIVYNVALNTGGVSGTTFLAAFHEMPIMVPIAFVLEFFVVGKLAKMLAFTVMRPDVVCAQEPVSPSRRSLHDLSPCSGCNR